MECPGCGYRYDDHQPPAVVGELREAVSACIGRFEVDPGDHGRVEMLARRPAPKVWSPIEYGCHVRDILLTQRERILWALVDDEPTFVQMYRDHRVALAAYAATSPADLARQLRVASDLLLDVLSRLDDVQWQRTGVYNFPVPTPRTIALIASHTLHEVRHHTLDIDRCVDL